MPHSKFSAEVANWELKQTDTPKGIQRNIRILIANGLCLELAKRMAYRIADGGIDKPRHYLRELLLDDDNLAPDYIRWVEGGFDQAPPDLSDLGDDEVFDPELWASIQAESEREIQYTTPIRKRLQRRARATEEELHLKDFYDMDERDYFWRESTRRVNTGSSSIPSTSRPNPRYQQ